MQTLQGSGTLESETGQGTAPTPYNPMGPQRPGGRRQSGALANRRGRTYRAVLMPRFYCIKLP